MTVRGRIIEGMPFFPARLRASRFGGFVWLLADTGAARTTLLDHDVNLLHIPADCLEQASVSMAGIGGVIRPFILRGVEIRLGERPGELPVLRDVYATRHVLHPLPPQHQARILSLPSILGRDIIDGFRFVYERATGTVLLER